MIWTKTIISESFNCQTNNLKKCKHPLMEWIKYAWITHNSYSKLMQSNIYFYGLWMKFSLSVLVLRVLVHCASTGVGCLVTQICHNMGANVSVTCLNRVTSVMETLGADKVFPLEATDYEKQLLNQGRYFSMILIEQFLMSVWHEPQYNVTAYRYVI